MSVTYHYAPKEKERRKDLENFAKLFFIENDLFHGGEWEYFQKLLDKFRQAVFNHGVNHERENRENKVQEL